LDQYALVLFPLCRTYFLMIWTVDLYQSGRTGLQLFKLATKTKKISTKVFQ